MANINLYREASTLPTLVFPIYMSKLMMRIQKKKKERQECIITSTIFGSIIRNKIEREQITKKRIFLVSLMPC